MVKKEQLDFPCMLAIRIAITHMFEGISSSSHADVLDYARDQVHLWTKSEEEIQDTLFLAFESALLVLPRNDRSNNSHRSRICLKITFVAMTDTPAYLARSLAQDRDRALFVKLLSAFSIVLEDKAPSAQKFKKFLGPDLETLSDI